MTENGELTEHFKNRFKPLLCVNANTISGIPITGIKSEWTRKKSILSLNHNDIHDSLECTCKGLLRAFAFLNFRCGIKTINDIPYKLMVEPIAFSLKDDKIWKNESKLNQIEYWYWSSIFSGKYGWDQNNVMVKDIELLYNFLSGNGKSKSAAKSNFDDRYNNIFDSKEFINKDLLLHTNEKIAGKSIQTSILQYVISKEPDDLLKIDGKKLKLKSFDYNLNLEDHHIIPINEAKKTISQSTKKFLS